MSRTELNAKIKELRELRRMADELATEIEYHHGRSKAGNAGAGRGYADRRRLARHLENGAEHPFRQQGI